jgi:hypothetical protein
MASPVLIIPKKVFIVPYRDRAENRAEFLHLMTTVILEDETEPYEIYFAHQCDTRPFNRGAMKNIGFLAIKQKYPLHYKEMTFIINDVDTYPAKKGLIDYTTTAGTVKHYHGFTYTLGGIFAIKGADFEKCRGFPNFWGWGLEDNLMQTRCEQAGLIIDRSIFYPIGDTVNILRPFDGFIKTVSRRDGTVYKWGTPDTFLHIRNLNYSIAQYNNLTNVFMVNIATFDVMLNPNDTVYIAHDLRKAGSKLTIQPNYKYRGWSMNRIFNK